ncbi:hypothetical protein [Spiroplasma endosymbiont of Melieria omissa]|uniref:hypothetical protein n=1 Tax=Spiroplasma endosymbiont of Melieria omissa TaxID=3139324 RepID=UPI003CCA766B
MPNDTIIQSNNYTLLKIIRSSISPLSAMIGTSAYYGQVISNPILGSINSLLFGKKLGLDIWNLNQRPNTKTKLINSSKKIMLGLANYAKFTTNSINPNPNPFPDDLLLMKNNTNNLMDWDTYS